MHLGSRKLNHRPLNTLAIYEPGLDLSEAAKSTGIFAFGCLDWTERGLHLGGPLGRAVTACLSEQGFAVRTGGMREVTIDGSPGRLLDGAASRR
jgi:hypothetical protein